MLGNESWKGGITKDYGWHLKQRANGDIIQAGKKTIKDVADIILEDSNC